MKYHNPAKTAFFKGWKKRDKYGRAMRDGRRTEVNKQRAKWEAEGRMNALMVLSVEADTKSREIQQELNR